MSNRDEDEEIPSSELTIMDYDDDDFPDETLIIGEVWFTYIYESIRFISILLILSICKPDEILDNIYFLSTFFTAIYT